MPYNSWADVVCLLAQRYDAKSNVKLGGFWSQLQASYVSSHTEELWYDETVCLWMTVYIHTVTWSTTERREIRNFPYPSVCELTGRQRLTIKKRNRNVGQFLASEVTNPGQNESQQMFALCDQREEKEAKWLARILKRN